MGYSEVSSATKFSIVVLGVFFVLLKGGECKPGDENNWKNVYSKLLETHNALIPPSPNMTIAVLLHFIKLDKVDTLNQKMTSTVQLELFWTDPTLTWDKSKSPGLIYVSLPPSHVWTPKIILTNSEDDNVGTNSLTGGNVIISPEGRVTWDIYTTLHSSCTIDVTYYPFDQQTCILRISSLEPAQQVATTRNINFAILDRFYLSVEWDIIEVPLYVNVHAAKPGSYAETDLTYYITIRRRTHWITQVCPSLALGLLTLIPCLLPRSRFLEKLIIQLTCLIGIFAVYCDVGNKLPPTTLVVPHIFKYLFPLAVFNLIHLTLTCILSHFGNTGSESNVKPAQPKWAPKEICTKICETFGRSSVAEPKTKEVDEAGGIAPEKDSKVVGPSTNECWVGVLHFFILAALFIGVGILVFDFMTDHPHAFEPVNQMQILKLYSVED